MRQEVVEGCSHLQVPGPDRRGCQVLGTEPARCPQGPEFGDHSFSHPKCPQAGQEGSLFILFPLSVESRPEGGQILQRPDREGTQGSGPTSARPRTPTLREQAVVKRANTLMEAAAIRPTAHMGPQHTGASEQLPFSEENQTAHRAQAPARGHRAAGRRLPVLSPTGSPPCWQHEGTKTGGLSWARRRRAQAESCPGQHPAERTPQLEEGEGVWLTWGRLGGTHRP